MADEQDTPTLDELRALLRLLQEADVQSFVGCGIQVAFREEPTFALPPPGPTVSTDGTRKVDGFKSDFHNPMAWPGANGKLLRFDGTYAE